MNAILLVTREERQNIERLVEMGLDASQILPAIGEIVSIPHEELTFPLYIHVDLRAPKLRFVDMAEEQRTARSSSVPAMPLAFKISIALAAIAFMTLILIFM